jgi:ComF family protein
MPKVPSPFPDAVTPFFYRGGAATVVQQLKYARKTPLAAPMASALTLHVSPIAPSIDRVIAIPLHPSRLRVREFNPSLLLAYHLTRALGLPLAVDDLIRVRPTPPQVGLSAREREENVRNAFAVARPGAVRGKRLLLIDDVYTTGATLREGKRALIAAGGSAVTLAAFCRAGWEGMADR